VGTRIPVYEYGQVTDMLPLPAIVRDPWYMTDVASDDRWNCVVGKCRGSRIRELVATIIDYRTVCVKISRHDVRYCHHIFFDIAQADRELREGINFVDVISFLQANFHIVIVTLVRSYKK